MLKKADSPAPPSLKEETVPVPELGGDVIVRGLLLKDHLSLSQIEGYGRMAEMLAVTVFVEGSDGTMVPLYTAQEWERFGARHYAVALKLWNTAHSIYEEGEKLAEKNSSAQSSDSPAASH